jgi:hypothetical protein
MVDRIAPENVAGVRRAQRRTDSRFRQLRGRQGGNGHMTMQEGERWICSNPMCRCEVVVVHRAGAVAGTNPQCSCGFAMRKVYAMPQIWEIRREEATGAAGITTRSF